MDTQGGDNYPNHFGCQAIVAPGYWLLPSMYDWKLGTCGPEGYRRM